MTTLSLEQYCKQLSDEIEDQCCVPLGDGTFAYLSSKASTMILKAMHNALELQMRADCSAICPACRERVPIRGSGLGVSQVHFRHATGPCQAEAIRQQWFLANTTLVTVIPE